MTATIQFRQFLSVVAKPKYRYLFSCLVLSMLLMPSSPAMADTPQGTIVSLSAQAEEKLPNDEVVVRFRIEAQGKNVDALRNKVNRISQAVDERLKSEKGVEQTTIGRRMEPIWGYDNATHKQVQNGWRLVQSVDAVSTELDAVPQWVDAIERIGARLDSLNFRASRQATNTTRERLRTQAIADFRRRAAATAKALDAFTFQIMTLSTDTTVPRPAPLQYMALAKAPVASSSPALEAGESRITVTVSGQILLPVKDYRVK